MTAYVLDGHNKIFEELREWENADILAEALNKAGCVKFFHAVTEEEYEEMKRNDGQFGVGS